MHRVGTLLEACNNALKHDESLLIDLRSYNASRFNALSAPSAVKLLNLKAYLEGFLRVYNHSLEINETFDSGLRPNSTPHGSHERDVSGQVSSGLQTATVSRCKTSQVLDSNLSNNEASEFDIPGVASWSVDTACVDVRIPDARSTVAMLFSGNIPLDELPVMNRSVVRVAIPRLAMDRETLEVPNLENVTKSISKLHDMSAYIVRMERGIKDRWIRSIVRMITRSLKFVSLPDDR